MATLGNADCCAVEVEVGLVRALVLDFGNDAVLGNFIVPNVALGQADSLADDIVCCLRFRNEDAVRAVLCCQCNMRIRIRQGACAHDDSLHVFRAKLNHHQQTVDVVIDRQHTGVLGAQFLDVGRPSVQAVVVAEYAAPARGLLAVGLALHSDEVGGGVGAGHKLKARDRVGRHGHDLVVAVNAVEVIKLRRLDVHQLCRVVCGVARLALVCSDMERAVCVAVAVAAATACERVSLVEVVGDGLATNTSLRRHADAVVDALALACARALGPADAVDFDVLFAFQCGNTVVQLGEVCLSGEARRVDSDLDLGNAVDDGVDVVGCHIGDGRALGANPLRIVGESCVGVQNLFAVGVLCKDADFLDEKALRHADAGNGDDDFRLAVLRVVNALDGGVFQLMHEGVERCRRCRRSAVADCDAGNLQCAFLRQQFADKGNAFVGGNRTVHLDTPFLCCLHNVVCVLDDAAAGPGCVCCGRALLLKCRGDSDERGLRIGRTGPYGALCAVLPAAIQNHVCGRSATLNHACAGVERVLRAAPLRCRQVNGRFARFEDDGRCVEPGLKREAGLRMQVDASPVALRDIAAGAQLSGCALADRRRGYNVVPVALECVRTNIEPLRELDFDVCVYAEVRGYLLS